MNWQKLLALPPAPRGGHHRSVPGALYGALRIARRMKALDPRIATVLGGGYVNTELRALSNPRPGSMTIDYVTYDDGEMPLLRIVQKTPLVRTRMRRRPRGLGGRHDGAVAAPPRSSRA